MLNRVDIDAANNSEIVQSRKLRILPKIGLNGSQKSPSPLLPRSWIFKGTSLRPFYNERKGENREENSEVNRRVLEEDKERISVSRRNPPFRTCRVPRKAITSPISPTFPYWKKEILGAVDLSRRSPIRLDLRFLQYNLCEVLPTLNIEEGGGDIVIANGKLFYFGRNGSILTNIIRNNLSLDAIQRNGTELTSRDLYEC